jgi:para-aminobenzoate synthetase component I
MQEYYQKLSHLPGFVVLESTDKARGRYDIVSAYPYDSIRIEPDALHREQTLKQLSNMLSIHPSVCDLPFQGGAIGYISYDLGAKRVGVESVPQPTLSDMPLLHLGLYDWAIISDHHLKKCTLFAANTQAQTRQLLDEILALWNRPSVDPKAIIKSNFVSLIARETYEDAFLAIYQSLISGRSYQVNLTQPFHAKYEGDVWAFYKKITQQNPVPFSAFLRTTEADILSFSPERFLLYNQGAVVTSPIKGTIGRSSDPSIDEQLKQELLSCEKNKAENVMIVDLLRNDLGKIAQPGSLQVTSLCEVESYNSVHHLVSTIKAQCLQEVSPFDAFLSCFPGGSITGAPKIESMRIINEQEPYSRGVYCGSIAYFSRHGYFDSNIAIRTITAKNNILHLAAGGGIVIDSKVEEEYQECLIKIAALINALS